MNTGRSKNTLIKSGLEILRKSPHYHDLEEFWIRSNLEELYRTLTEEKALDQWDEALDKLAQGYPMGRVLPCTYFYGFKIFNHPDVLIPRPDSEVLVEAVLNKASDLLENASDKKLLRITELGCGTGALLLALAKLLLEKGYNNFKLYGTDISEAAVETALCNRNYHGLEDYIEITQADLWPLDMKEGVWTCDLLYSNPPYLRHDEFVSSDLDLYEPGLALDGGAKGLDIIKRILAEGAHYLTKGTEVYIEHGPDQAELIRPLAVRYGWKDLGVIEDLAGRDRVSRFLLN